MHTIICGRCKSRDMKVKIDENMITVYCKNCSRIVRQWSVSKEHVAYKIDSIITECRKVGIEPIVKADEDPEFEGLVVQITHRLGDYDQ